MRKALRPVLWLLLILSLMVQALPALGEGTASTRWADASDEIDKYLDTAFEDYLAGDAGTAYSNVNDAYFRVYETTGFERQTMSYISGVRKNAVEMQFSACKAAVKKENTDPETIVSVRSALFKLKAMIREDGNKLAAQQDGVQSENKFYKNGELVSTDPYPEYSPDPNAAAKYASWYEAASLTKELLDTAYLAYLDKDFDAADDNLNTAYYSVYEESGLSHKIYTELGVKDRRETEKQFTELRNLVSSGNEKYQKNKYRTTSDKTKQVLLKKAKTLDEMAAAEKGAAEVPAEEAAAEVTEEAQSSPQWLTFLGAFGIIVREGLEAILVIAAIIAYLVKSGNGKSLKNVYIGALAGILASFAAAAVLYFVKQAVAGAGMAQELIEGVTALAFTAFLSVFREGAEVVLFYQPMLQEGNAGMVWAGFGAGVVILVFVYLAITKLSIKLPIKVFFTATSILMAVMCVSFLGSGIKELAEGNLFDLTLRVPGIPENDVIQIFGIYPYLETLVPQLILAIILLVTFMIAHYRGKLAAQRKELTAAH